VKSETRRIASHCGIVIDRRERVSRPLASKVRMTRFTCTAVIPTASPICSCVSGSSKRKPDAPLLVPRRAASSHSRWPTRVRASRRPTLSVHSR
jgi:hypothetical protein